MTKRLMLMLLFAGGTLLSSCTKKCEDPRNGDGCIDPSRIRKDAVVTQEYDPVCGCDGKTYGNPSTANAAGVIRYTKGACAGTTNK